MEDCKIKEATFYGVCENCGTIYWSWLDVPNATCVSCKSLIKNKELTNIQPGDYETPTVSC